MLANELDDVDRRILNILQLDASHTNAELAELVHVSPPTCLRRVKYMNEGGIIERQVAIVSPEKVGARLTAIVEITLDVQAAERTMRAARIHRLPIVDAGGRLVGILALADLARHVHGPALGSDDGLSTHSIGLTLAVIILLIVATLTLSYLMRRPSSTGEGITQLAPTAPIAATIERA